MKDPRKAKREMSFQAMDAHQCECEDLLEWEFHDSLALIVTNFMNPSIFSAPTRIKSPKAARNHKHYHFQMKVPVWKNVVPVSLSHQVSAEETVPRGIKHASKGTAEYIQPDLKVRLFCFITEEINSLLVDSMPHTDQQSSFMPYS